MDQVLQNVPPRAATQQVISSAFARLQLRERVRVLRRLLRPVGPLALLVVAGGAFAKYARQARSAHMRLIAEDAARVSPAQVGELVRYVEQSEPTSLQQVTALLARLRSGR